jgi:hypothetical protein
LLGAIDTVYRFSELFDFAARLAVTPAGADEMEVRAELRGLNSRRLWMEDPSRMWFEEYVSRVDTIPVRVVLSRADLVAAPRRHAASAARQVFEVFGWDTNDAVIESLQQGLRG